jgi:hypothetical protein
MENLTQAIMAKAETLPEGTPICAKMLLGLGSRAAIDQALSRLVRRGKLLRASRGIYVSPVTSRFGSRAPSPEKVVEALASQRGEMVVPSAAASANALGLTTQVPVQTVYLTSGPSRKMTLGKQSVRLVHAPKWQFVLGKEHAGEVVRALAWAGRGNIRQTLNTIAQKVPHSELEQITRNGSSLPSWIVQPVAQLTVHA